MLYRKICYFSLRRSFTKVSDSSNAIIQPGLITVFVERFILLHLLT